MPRRARRSKPKSRKPGPANGLEEATPSRHKDGPFPIVGIGASAGGLEALEQNAIKLTLFRAQITQVS